MDILIVDDHQAMREEIICLLQAELDSPMVAQAGTGEEGLNRARTLRPDIVLVDIVLPGINGIEASKAIHTELPETQILVISNHAGRFLVEAAISAGASGYVRKDRAYEELVPAIRRLAAGGQYFGDDLRG
jgi:DNA-binding NarL/FixJ family response regulator